MRGLQRVCGKIELQNEFIFVPQILKTMHGVFIIHVSVKFLKTSGGSSVFELCITEDVQSHLRIIPLLGVM